MYFDEELGKVCDIIAYITIYFNKELWDKNFRESGYSEPDKYFEFYDEINALGEEIPQCLYPLFFHTSDKYSILTKYFFHSINIRNITIDKLISYIRQEDELKRLSYSHYLDTTNIELDLIEIHEKLKNINLNSDLLYEVHFLLCNYEYIINELIIVINKLYKKISYLHCNRRSLIQKKIDDLDKVKLCEYLKSDINMFENIRISFSFMNKHLAFFNYNCDEMLSILGLNYEKIILTNAVNNVNLEEFLNICSNPCKISILKEFADKEEITVSELVNNIYTSQSTAARHLDDLKKKSIIFISSQDTKKFYYKLNKEYFRLLKLEIEEYFKKIGIDGL